jgi:hypothetical protein
MGDIYGNRLECNTPTDSRVYTIHVVLPIVVPTGSPIHCTNLKIRTEAALYGDYP